MCIGKRICEGIGTTPPFAPIHTHKKKSYFLLSYTNHFITGETQYNEVLGTMKFLFISDILLYQYILNNTKQNKLFHWDLRKQFVISGILLYQFSLYRVSTVPRLDSPLRLTLHYPTKLLMYMYDSFTTSNISQDQNTDM